MATMRSIAANRAMETTATTSTGDYALEGPVAGYEAFRDAIATGEKVAYCVQQATVDGNGDLVSMDYEIGIGTLTHGTPDTLARTQVLQSTNGDAAVNWGPGEKTIFSVAPVQLLPMMAAALGTNDGGKALVVDPTSRFFEVADLFLKLGGGTVTGQTVFARGSDNTIIVRDTRNTDNTVVSPIRLEGGDGSGNDITFRFVLDGANGLKRFDINFTMGGSEFWFNRDGRLTLGANGSGNTDAVTKQQMDAAVVAGPHVAAGYSNLRIDVTGNATVDVDADFLTVFDSSGNGRGLRNVDLTINLGNSGANGRDTGSEAANTWYAVYVIYNPTTDTVAGLLSTSGTSPTLPSGYTFARRVGWVRNDGSSNLFRTRQRGENVNYVIGTNPTAFPVLASGAAGDVTTPTWVAVAVSTAVPSTAVDIDVALSTNGANRIAMVAPNNSYGAHTSTSVPPSIVLSTVSGSFNGYSHRGRLPLESSNIYWASTNHTDHALLATGWRDAL